MFRSKRSSRPDQPRTCTRCGDELPSEFDHERCFFCAPAGEFTKRDLRRFGGEDTADADLDLDRARSLDPELDDEQDALRIERLETRENPLASLSDLDASHDDSDAWDRFQEHSDLVIMNRKDRRRFGGEEPQHRKKRRGRRR